MQGGGQYLHDDDSSSKSDNEQIGCGSKNEKFIELFTKCEELKAVTQNNHREIQEIRRSQKEI